MRTRSDKEGFHAYKNLDSDYFVTLSQVHANAQNGTLIRGNPQPAHDSEDECIYKGLEFTLNMCTVYFRSNTMNGGIGQSITLQGNENLRSDGIDALSRGKIPV